MEITCSFNNRNTLHHNHNLWPDGNGSYKTLVTTRLGNIEMAEGIESLANPEDLELARKASEQMGDAEYMMEQQNLLPENMRRGTPLAFVSDMGYSGDYPQTEENAKIISYGMPGNYDRSFGNFPSMSRGNKLIAGFYERKSETPQDLEEEYGKLDLFGHFGLPEPGAVMMFNSPEYMQALEDQENTGRSGKESVANVLSHELFHRGATDVLPLSELENFAQEDYYEGPLSSLFNVRIEGDKAKKVFTKMQSLNGQHFYLDALDKLSIANGDVSELNTLDKEKIQELEAAGKVATQFFTPKRQENLMLRAPIPAVEPR